MKFLSDLSKLEIYQIDLKQTLIPKFASVVELDQQMEDELWSQQTWKDIVFNSGRCFELWIAVPELEEEVGSFCLIEIVGKSDFVHLHKIVSCRRYRGKGLAARLLERVLRRVRELGCSRIILEVATENEKAIALYRSRQFSQIHTVAKFYQNGKDAFIMEKSFENHFDDA